MNGTQTRPKSTSQKILRRRDRMRQRLVEVAIEKFAARGPDSVSVDDLVEDAEIAKKTFYTFFGSKEELLSDIVRPVFERGIEELSSLKTDSAQKTAQGVADVYLTLWEEYPQALAVAMKLDMKYFFLIEEVHTKFSTALRKKLKVLEDSGELRNGNAIYSSRIIARSAILLLEVYSEDESPDQLFRTTIEGLLLKCPNRNRSRA